MFLIPFVVFDPCDQANLNIFFGVKSTTKKFDLISSHRGTLYILCVPYYIFHGCSDFFFEPFSDIKIKTRKAFFFLLENVVRSTKDLSRLWLIHSVQLFNLCLITDT